jgi:hypothetical protein
VKTVDVVHSDHVLSGSKLNARGPSVNDNTAGGDQGGSRRPHLFAEKLPNSLQQRISIVYSMLLRAVVNWRKFEVNDSHTSTFYQFLSKCSTD